MMSLFSDTWDLKICLNYSPLYHTWSVLGASFFHSRHSIVDLVLSLFCKVSRSLLPTFIEREPMRLRLEIEIEWHSKCNTYSLYLGFNLIIKVSLYCLSVWLVSCNTPKCCLSVWLVSCNTPKCACVHVCICVWSFPRKNAELKEKFGTKLFR